MLTWVAMEHTSDEFLKPGPKGSLLMVQTSVSPVSFVRAKTVSSSMLPQEINANCIQLVNKCSYGSLLETEVDK